MSQTDFILMESVEVPGSGGTSWTDQETLLLLEALEIFKAKWGDIAEHVATKSKAQCMLHFLQMPILDSFLDDSDVNQTSQETTEQVSAEKGTSPDKMEVEDKVEGIETTDEKTSEKTNANCAETETELAYNNVVGNKDTNISGDINVVASSNTGESDKSSYPDPAKKETSADVDIPGKVTSNVVIDVLKSAFEAVGHIPEQEDMGSFAEAGNPVMALAAFLAGLVEHDDAITSCCSSLRAISEISPALELATRHCFILQDPPNDLKDLPVSVSPANTGAEQQQDEDVTPNPNDTDKDSNEKEEVALSVEKQNTTSTSPKDDKGSNRKESSYEASQVEVKPNSSKDSGNPIAQVEKGGASDNTRDGRNSILHPVTLNDTNEPSSVASQEAGEDSTKDTTDPERVEGDKPNSEESLTDDLPLQGKVEPNVHHESNQTSLETGNIEEPNSNKNFAVDNDSLQRLQRAAATAISASAVKAKLLAQQEEDQIRRLAALVIEKQFQKMQAKMSFFTEIENLLLRVREYTEKTRKKLMMERSVIIAARMATIPSRPNQPGAGAPGIRLPVGYGMNQQLRRP